MFVGTTQNSPHQAVLTLCLPYQTDRTSVVPALQNNRSSTLFQGNLTQVSFRLSLPSELTHTSIRLHTGAPSLQELFLERRRSSEVREVSTLEA